MNLRLIYNVALLLLLVAPLVGLAAPSLWPTGYWGGSPNPLVPCGTQLNASGTITNPCKLCDFITLAQNLIYFGLSLLVFVIAPILFLYGGILLIVAGGSEERMSAGKKVITGTVVGLAIALGGFLIINTFIGLIGAQVGEGGSSWSSFTCAPPAGF